MKLLFITDSYSQGGLETHLLTYFKYLKLSGHGIILATRFAGERPYFKDLDLYVDKFHEITFDDYSSRSILALAEKVSEIIRIEDVDLVHIHPFLCIYAGFLAAVENNKPAMLTLHGKLSLFSYDYPTAHFLNNVLLRGLRLLTVNKNIFKTYDGRLDIHYLPNPIDQEFWKRSRGAEAEDYLLMVSRLSPDKSHSVDTALRKLRDIIDGLELKPGIKVAGAGSGEELLKERHPGVEFVGYKDSGELRGLMENALAVFGMGRVTLESLFLGKNSFIVNYDGDITRIDEKTFREAEEFNFNGTSLQENITPSIIKDLAGGGRASIPPDYLNGFSATSIVSRYKELADGLVKGFRGYKEDIRTAAQLYRYHLAADAKASELNQAVLQKDGELGALMAEKHSLAGQLGHAAAERDGLRAEVHANAQQISALSAEKDALAGQLGKTGEQIVSLTSQLGKIYTSDFWKAASFYYRIRNGLLRHPHRFVSVLRREGIKAVARKTFGKLSGQVQPVSGPQPGEEKANRIVEYDCNPYGYLSLLKDIDVSVLERDFGGEDISAPFSLITTIKNESENIADFLMSIEHQSLRPDEVIIVDGGSSDNTAELVEEYKAASALNIRFISQEGANIAQGRNIGIREAQNELIVFADAGCRLDRDLCLNLVGCLGASGNADLAGGIYKPLVESEYSKYFICDWEAVRWKDFLPSARALAVRKSLAMKIGGFPEYLTLTGEDTLFDINYRRVSKAWVFNKRAVVHWNAPHTLEAAKRLSFSYCKGDGESSLADSSFYGQIQWKWGGPATDDDILQKSRFDGYIDGRAARPRIEIEKREIAGVVLILSGVPLTDSGGGQRGAQVALEFARRNYKVVYVNVYPSFEKPHRIFLDIDFTLIELYHINDFSMDEFLARYVDVLDRSLILMEFPHPAFIPFVGKARAASSGMRVVYDHIDNWNSTLGWVWYDSGKEAEIISGADFLLASAATLKEDLEAKFRRAVALVPNAVNTYLFDHKRAYARPKDMPSGRPAVTYTGAMWGEWFDWELLCDCASRLREFNFLLIGGVPEERAEAISKAHGNIFFLGLKPQSALPAYLSHSDACIIPFKQDDITKYVNPLKVYEYLAMLKPVVATGMEELHGIPGVLLSRGNVEFAENISRAVSSGVKAEDVIEFIGRNNWGTRVDSILGLLEGPVDQPVPEGQPAPESATAAGDRFREAMVESFKSRGELSPQDEIWLNYALDTNKRGQAVVTTVSHFMPSLRSRMHLDVGSGYGGTCIEMARAGAVSVGLELNEAQHRLSMINLEDHRGVGAEFINADFMDWDRVKGLGPFDVITCDNVIEHVDMAERLIMHMSRLLVPGGIVYLTCPNAFSVGQIRKDCHYGLFGISLLEPSEGVEYVRHAMSLESYDVSHYHSYPDYEDMFRKFGFSTSFLNPVRGSEDDIAGLLKDARGLRDEAPELLARCGLPEALASKVRLNLETHIKRIETDVEFYHAIADGSEKEAFGFRLMRDYRTELWYLVLRRETANLSSPGMEARTPEGYCFPAEWIKYARAQAKFFYNLAMENLPGWLAADIEKNALSILDFGCSMGDGVDILARRFRKSKVAGIDIDKPRIEMASQFYPRRNFIAGDIKEMADKFDCIFSSNTLEHFQRPFDAVRELLAGRANKYMVLLLPFQEYQRIEGHYFTFDHDNLPPAIEDFSLVHVKEMDCRHHPANHYYGEQVHWNGKQALLVYVKENEKKDIGRMSSDAA